MGRTASGAIRHIGNDAAVSSGMSLIGGKGLDEAQKPEALAEEKSFEFFLSHVFIDLLTNIKPIISTKIT